MINPYQPKVQQKLAHARLLLSMAQDCGDDLMSRQKSEALLMASVMSLGVAYVLYLKELAANAQLAGVEQVHTLEQLEYALNAAGRSDSAVTELQQLYQTGWLSELMTGVEQAQYPAPASELPGSGQMINVGMSRRVDITVAWVADCLTQFDQMSDRQRHSNLEY